MTSSFGSCVNSFFIKDFKKKNNGEEETFCSLSDTRKFLLCLQWYHLLVLGAKLAEICTNVGSLRIGHKNVDTNVNIIVANVESADCRFYLN